jgi:uncharacterized membrane protein YsdA (DUF1294 family)
MNGWLSVLWGGIALMSLVLFGLMGVDKRRARKGRWRVRERTLFLLALLGGASGGTLGMFLFHHKTRHWTFRLIFPILAAVQLLGAVYLSLQLI